MAIGLDNSASLQSRLAAILAEVASAGAAELRDALGPIGEFDPNPVVASAGAATVDGTSFSGQIVQSDADVTISFTGGSMTPGVTYEVHAENTHATDSISVLGFVGASIVNELTLPQAVAAGEKATFTVKNYGSAGTPDLVVRAAGIIPA